ncbi:hypothetical protein ACHIPZ_18415 [Antrihabitans sp. NCIMB 15449]|uniref:DUF8175 domain-containing protein n=1 Tax=Antrihabitans spumae TaxID=3373370 RepID=A0ABW7JQS2_9NOCA
MKTAERTSKRPDTTTEPGAMRRMGGWLAGSRTTLYVSAAFIALMLVAGVGIIGARLIGDDDTATPTRPTSAGLPTPTGTPPAPDLSPGEPFNPPSADMLGRPIAYPKNPAGQPLPQQLVDRDAYSCPAPPTCPPLDAPTSVMWQIIGPFALPFSTSDGPTRIEGPLVSGYTRTPQGAALAAWQVQSRVAISRAHLDAARDTQIVAVPGQDLSSTEEWDISTIAPVVPRPSAFRITGWSADATFAVIQYAVPDRRRVGNNWMIVQLQALWQDGDWKLRGADVEPGPFAPLTTLSGWSEW